MNTAYIALAFIVGIGIPLLGAALTAGRLLERLDKIRELFSQALEHWKAMEAIQDSLIKDHEIRLRNLESGDK